MNFQLGNLRVQKLLFSQINNNFPHAILLSGPKGTGKFNFLKNLAHEILGKKTSIPPELVLVDKLYMEGTQSDLEDLAQYSSFNQIHRKKKKTRSNSLGVDDISSFTKQLHETVAGKYKIVIVRDIERMTIASSNKFLKILEEPPQKTIFLLTTSQPQKLLPTIISRCQVKYFSLLSPQEMQIEISQSPKFFSDNEKKLLMILSSGKSEEFIKMMNDDEYLAEKKEKYNQVKKIISSSPLEKMNEAEGIAKTSMKEIEELLQTFFLVMRTELKEKPSSVTALDEIDNTREAILKNGNKRMCLERLFLQL